MLYEGATPQNYSCYVDDVMEKIFKKICLQTILWLRRGVTFDIWAELHNYSLWHQHFTYVCDNYLLNMIFIQHATWVLQVAYASISLQGVNTFKYVRGHSLGVGKISIYSYFGEGGGQTHSYVIFFKSIFYIRKYAVKWFGRDHTSITSGR